MIFVILVLMKLLRIFHCSMQFLVATAAQNELKIEVPTETRLCSTETVTYEEIERSDASFIKYLNIEEV